MTVKEIYFNIYNFICYLNIKKYNINYMVTI